MITLIILIKYRMSHTDKQHVWSLIKETAFGKIEKSRALNSFDRNLSSCVPIPAAPRTKARGQLDWNTMMGFQHLAWRLMTRESWLPIMCPSWDENTALGCWLVKNYPFDHQDLQFYSSSATLMICQARQETSLSLVILADGYHWISQRLWTIAWASDEG